VRCLALLLVAALAFTADPPPVGGAHANLVRYEGSRMSMACLYEITAYGSDSGVLARVVEEAFDEVDRIDRLMSHYRPDSPLSRLNREAAGGPVAVEAELFDFIAQALDYSRDSGGAFDVTVGPLMKAWGFFRGDGRLPARGELAAVLQRVGYRHVVLDHQRGTVRFDVPGVELDLGGIAKGYAVDRAVDVLRRHGVSAALVSACGSTMYALGAPPDLDAWQLEVADPLDADRTAFPVRIRDRALSVAGSSEKFFEVDDTRYSHIMDPRTGMPVQGVLSVAVLAPTGTAGDALDDAFFVQGVEKSTTAIERVEDIEAWFLVPAPDRGWKMVHLPR
jgi:FAD:protein FMN transferase